MINSCYKISLDIQDHSSNVLLRAKKGDTGRTLFITLTDGRNPYAISEECRAVFTAKKADGKTLFNECRIIDHVIVYEFTPQTTSVAGKAACEIKLYGADEKLLTSAHFTLMVDDTVYNEGDEVESAQEVTALTALVSETIELIEDVEHKVESGAFKGAPGDTPYIGENGNWWVGKTDTGVSAGGSANAVRFDGPQDLTPKEQARARANIGAIAGVEKLETAYLELEQGGITSSNGANATGSNRLRSFYLSIADVIQVYSNNSNYNLYGHFYDASMAYVGNTGGWVSGFVVSAIKILFPNASYFRIVARRTRDQEIIPSDAVGVFEMSYMKTVIGAESVLYTPQSLSKYQQAQARANIGVVPTLVVDASGDAWSHTFSEIKAHVEAGGFAVLTNGSEYFPLIFCSGQIVQFAVLEDDGYLYIYELRNNDAAQYRDVALVKAGEYFPPLVVTITDDTFTPSFSRIKAHVEAGGTAIAKCGGEYFQLTFLAPKVAEFALFGSDGFYYIWTLKEDGTVEQTDIEFVKQDNLNVPAKGIDYFTDEDKAEMVKDVIASLPVYTGEVV